MDVYLEHNASRSIGERDNIYMICCRHKGVIV
jgi:hypothetical protein